MLDDYGMYMTYGEAVNAEEMSAAAATCRKGLSRAAASSATSARTKFISYDDVDAAREGRLCRPAAVLSSTKTSEVRHGSPTYWPRR